MQSMHLLYALTSNLRAAFANKMHVYITLFLTQQSGRNGWYSLTDYNVNVTYHLKPRGQKENTAA